MHTPMEQNHKLTTYEGDFCPDHVHYRRLVGHLVYLRATRPKLSYAMHKLVQFMQNPRIKQCKATIRVVHYLKGCLGQGILLSS